MNSVTMGTMEGYEAFAPEAEALLAAMEAAPAVIASVFVMGLLVLLAERIIVGVLCRKMAAKKGYKGYFWMGFFLSWIGFVYVIFLPDLKMQKYLRMAAMRIQIMEDRLEQLEDTQKEMD